MESVTQRDKKIIINPSVVLREEFDDWAILFNPESANAVGINPVGIAIWKLMDGHRGVDDIIAEISKRFSDAPTTVDEDISAFIEDLYKKNFIGYEVNEMK